MDKLEIAHFFSGIGAFEEALRNLKLKFEIIHYCDIKPSAQSKAYSLINNISEDKNLGDIKMVDETKLNDFDVMFYGFPCQDLSIIGARQGIIKNKTRSGLLYEALRIIKEKQPKYLIAENVKMLVGNNFINDFRKLILELENMGYRNYWKVLNTLDFGLPHNRERIFIVSIREDIQKGFIFPKGRGSKKTLRQILDLGQKLDYKYYLTEENIKSYLYKKGDFGKRFNIKNPYVDDASCLVAKSSKGVITNNFILDIYGVRGLTEKEYFRLQGFKDEYVDLLLENGITSSQLYQMMGNTISVPVLEDILYNLLIDNQSFKQLKFC